MMAALPPRHAHFMARLVFFFGFVVLGEMGTAVPHAWRLPLAAAVVLWLCRPIRCSRIAHEPKHLMRGCAPARMSEATTSAAVPMVKELRKNGKH